MLSIKIISCYSCLLYKKNLGRDTPTSVGQLSQRRKQGEMEMEVKNSLRRSRRNIGYWQFINVAAFYFTAPFQRIARIIDRNQNNKRKRGYGDKCLQAVWNLLIELARVSKACNVCSYVCPIEPTSSYSSGTPLDGQSLLSSHNIVTNNELKRANCKIRLRFEVN